MKLGVAEPTETRNRRGRPVRRRAWRGCGAGHGHAAGLIRAGVHAKVVQDRLGHSSAAFTMDVYGHGSGALQVQAAEAFAAGMRNADAVS